MNLRFKTDFNDLYRQMNGMLLQEMNKIIYLGCKLWRYHRKDGIVYGVQIGMQIAKGMEKLKNEKNSHNHNDW